MITIKFKSKKDIGFKIGQMFCAGDQLYLLAQVDTSKVCLICLSSDKGNRYHQPVKVNIISQISLQELSLCYDGKKGLVPVDVEIIVL